MLLEPKYRALFAVTVLMLVGFTTYYVAGGNFEFMVYIAVIVFFLVLIIATRNRVEYPMPILWGLVAWALLHMAGGSFYWGGTRFYDIILLPLVGAPYDIIKYDQAVHAFGFFVTTFVAYHLLRPHLAGPAKGRVGLAVVLAVAGMGAGALNEVVEFATTVVSSSTGVGGYINNSLDLVANGVGAVIAAIWIYFKAEA
jgi:putative membrane protein